MVRETDCEILEADSETRRDDRRDSVESRTVHDKPKKQDRADLDPYTEIERAIGCLQAEKDVDRSFRVVYDAYYLKVRRHFERKGVPPEDRPDLIQNTFFRIYKGVKGLKNLSRFEPFLRTTAQRVFLKWLERANSRNETHGGRTRVIPDEDEILDFLVSDEPWPVPLRPAASPEDDLGHSDLLDRVKQAIKEMPRAMGRCAWMRFVCGMTNKEITEVLHKKPGDVGYQLFQARKRLAEKLRDHRGSGSETDAR